MTDKTEAHDLRIMEQFLKKTYTTQVLKDEGAGNTS